MLDFLQILMAWPNGLDPSMWSEFWATHYPLRPIVFAIMLFGYIRILRLLLLMYGHLGGTLVNMAKVGAGVVGVVVASLFSILSLLAILPISAQQHPSDFFWSFQVDGVFTFLLMIVVNIVWFVFALVFTIVWFICTFIGYYLLPFIVLLFVLPIPFLIYGFIAGLHYHTVPHPVRKHIDARGNIDDFQATAETMRNAHTQNEYAFVHENMRRHAEQMRDELADIEQQYGSQAQRDAQTRRTEADEELAEQIMKTARAKRRAEEQKQQTKRRQKDKKRREEKQRERTRQAYGEKYR